MKTNGLLLGGTLLVPVVLFGAVFSLLLLTGPTTSTAATCHPAGAPTGSLAGASVAGYEGDQLTNAALILAAGQHLDLPLRARTIGVMTAMGESSLHVLDHGDSAGPDSRGLFQQRGNGAWGSYADRMDPTISATNFFQALRAVPGWETLEPTIAAHRVQHNADPYHYARYWDAAITVTAALQHLSTSDLNSCLDNGTAGDGDDYPWPTSPVNTANPATNFNYRECVDFAWWRLLQQVGTPTPPYKYDSLTIRPGSALSWKAAWDREGWPTGTTPRVGAIIWYSPGTGGSDPTYGHVAVVRAINPDGMVQEEGYNGETAPNDHRYYTRTIPANLPSAYLYIPGRT
ncbi:MAG: surface antigen [Spirosoma sp.]|nr:surface antigen [Spirosoma sp.]